MQQLSNSFKASVMDEDSTPNQIGMLEPVRTALKTYLDERMDIHADVVIYERPGNYPILLLTPNEETQLEPLKQALKQTNVTHSMFPGIHISDILATIEKQGKEPFGVALNASRDIVACFVRSLSNPISAMNAAPALHAR